MHKDPYIFAQLVKFLDRSKFNRIVTKYEGDKYIKSYTCWNQLLTMMFGQLSNRESLRDLIVAMEAHAGKLYHLGIGKSVTRSNLSKANEQRNYRIFEEYATFMIAEARKRRINKIFELDGHVYAFDSTTIDLCLSVFEWAKFRKHKGGIKLHTLYDIEAIRSTILKRKYLHLCILHLPIFTTQRLCLRFHTNLERTTYSTADITISAILIR